MPNDLSIVSGLTGQTLHGVALIVDFTIAHHLYFLRRFGNAAKRTRAQRNRTVHQLRLRIKTVIKQRLKRPDLFSRSDRISPNPCNFPDVDLTIGDDVGPGRGKVTCYSTAYAIYRLPDVDWDTIEITQSIYANGIGQLSDSVSSETKIGSQRISESSTINLRSLRRRVQSRPVCV